MSNSIFLDIVQSGHIDQLRQYLSHAANNMDLTQALKISVELRNYDKTNLLLEKGANPNASYQGGRTILMIAAELNLRVIVYLLVSFGAKVDATDYGGRTALFYSSRENAKKSAKALLRHGANVNHKSQGGFTPLMFACYFGSKFVAKLLLKKGALVDSRGKLGATALMFAAQNNATACAILLLQRRANVNAKDEDKHTPLDWAIYHNAVDIQQELRQVGGLRGRDIVSRRSSSLLSTEFPMLRSISEDSTESSGDSMQSQSYWDPITGIRCTSTSPVPSDIGSPFHMRPKSPPPIRNNRSPHPNQIRTSSPKLTRKSHNRIDLLPVDSPASSINGNSSYPTVDYSDTGDKSSVELEIDSLDESVDYEYTADTGELPPDYPMNDREETQNEGPTNREEEKSEVKSRSGFRKGRNGKRPKFPHATDKDGWTFLEDRARVERDRLVDDIINENVDCNGSVDNKKTPPLSSAIMRKSKDLIKLFLDERLDVDFKQKDAFGKTPLMHAVEHGLNDIVSLLSDRDVGVEEQDLMKNTALMMAVAIDNKVITQALLDRNACFTTPIGGKTAVDCATAANATASLKLLIKRLGRYSTPITTRALFFAARYNAPDTTAMLLNAGANPHATDSQGRTPLFHTAITDATKVAEALINKGAKINARDVNNVTPLMAAVYFGAKNVERLLISEGADSTCVDKCGRSIGVYRDMGYGDSTLC